MNEFFNLEEDEKKKILEGIQVAVLRGLETNNTISVIPAIISLLGLRGQREVFFGPYFMSLVKRIILLHNNSESQSRPALRSLITDQFSRKQLESIGMKVTHAEFYYSRKINNDKLTLIAYKPRNLEVPMADQLANVRNVVKFCLAFSDLGRVSYNLPVKPKFCKIEAEENEYSSKSTYLLWVKRSQLFTIYKLGRESTICRATFYRCIPPNFGEAKKRTDLCELCYEGMLLKIRHTGMPLPENVANTLAVLENHIQVLQAQKAAFRAEVDNLDDRSVIIILDFKENMVIGGGLNEVGRTFYSKSAVSVLGFAVISREDGLLSIDYHDFLSSILSHDSKFAGECLVQLLNILICKGYLNLSIWSDNGPHFRSKEFLYYGLVLATRIFPGIVSVNRFCEYHGKNVVDSHFGSLSRSFEQLEKRMNIATLQDLKKAFEEDEQLKKLARLGIPKSKTTLKNSINNVYFYEYVRVLPETGVVTANSQGVENVSTEKYELSELCHQLNVSNIHMFLSFRWVYPVLYAAPITSMHSSLYTTISYSCSTKVKRITVKTSEHRQALSKDFEPGPNMTATLEKRMKLLASLASL